MSIKEKLPEYNALAKKKGLKPIDKWRGSEANLDHRIERMKKEFAVKKKTVVAEGAYPNERIAKQLTGHTGRGPVKATLKRKEDKQVKAPINSVKTKPTGDGVKLNSICRELDINDKQARAKLRRLYASGDTKKLPALINDKWLFASADVPAVKKLLHKEK